MTVHNVTSCKNRSDVMMVDGCPMILWLNHKTLVTPTASHYNMESWNWHSALMWCCFSSPSLKSSWGATSQHLVTSRNALHLLRFCLMDKLFTMTYWQQWKNLQLVLWYYFPRSTETLSCNCRQIIIIFMMLVNDNCKHYVQQSNSKKKDFLFTQFIELTL